MQELEDNFKKSGGTFKKFKIGELFESHTGDVDLQNKDLTEDGDYFINSGTTNWGIKGKVTKAAKLFSENTLTVDFFGNTYYRDFKYKLATHNHVFSLSSKIIKNREIGLYEAATFSYLRKLYSFNAMLTRPLMNEKSILLPVINDELAFEYMQDYVRELEQDYVRELDAYLKVTGLDNYELTDEDKSILLLSPKFKPYCLKDLFYKLSSKYLKKDDKFKSVSLTKNNLFSVPVVYCKKGNNGIMYWAKKGDFETHSQCISIIYNGAIAAGSVYAQEEETGVLAECYLIDLVPQYKNTSFFAKRYIASIMDHSIYQKYSRDNLATWSNKVENEIILLPTDENGEINFLYMEKYIKAIEKLIIKDLVDWKNKVIRTTKEVVSNDS